jgi:predicted RNA binding protein YcfA (HicA-like mRNA interferase family)
MKILKIITASHGLPQMKPSDVRNFLINFLGYSEVHTKGSHHKFQKSNRPNAELSFNEDGDIKGDSGFKNMLKQIGFSIPLFNKYWNNRKEWLKKARINREKTIRELMSSGVLQDIDSLPVHDMSQNNEKLNKLINQVPYVKRYFQNLISFMSEEEAYNNLYEYVISIEALKNAYISLN